MNHRWQIGFATGRDVRNRRFSDDVGYRPDRQQQLAIVVRRSGTACEQKQAGNKKNAGNFEHAPIVRNAEADSSLLVSREGREENKEKTDCLDRGEIRRCKSRK